MTIILRSNDLGLGYLRNTLRALMNATSFFAISGNIPTSAKEAISTGDKMSRADSILAICVPAFMYTTVPANMPIWLTI